MKKRQLIEDIPVKKLTMYNIFDKIYYNNKEDFYMLKRKIEKSYTSGNQIKIKNV